MSRAVRTRSRRLLVGVVAAALTGGVTAVAPAASAAPAGVEQCEVLLDEPARAAEVAAAEPAVLAEAAEVNDQTVTELKALAKLDKTLWLGECGRAFYVEPARSGTDRSNAEQAPSVQAAQAAKTVAPLSETFTLESNPASTKVIYLDFTGETVTGSAWDDGATPLVANPYSKDATVDTNFSDAELTDIQAIWQAAAEDYAPFDVNVTTHPAFTEVRIRR